MSLSTILAVDPAMTATAAEPLVATESFLFVEFVVFTVPITTTSTLWVHTNSVRENVVLFLIESLLNVMPFTSVPVDNLPADPGPPFSVMMMIMKIHMTKQLTIFFLLYKLFKSK